MGRSHCRDRPWQRWLRRPVSGETYDNMPGFLTGGVPFDWGPELRRDSRYALSSWTYAAAGLCQVALASHAYKLLPWWWWRAEGFVLVAMSAVSHVADVSGVDCIGLAHAMDRLLASGLSVAFIAKFPFLIERMNWLQLLLGTCAVTSAAWCFVSKRAAVRQRDVEKYRYWTLLWHVSFPGFGCLWFFYSLFRVTSCVAFA
eukprot:TRINITY_DN62449_c0_g1_i1.p1 TRINITY_DN62449_c0_g1~~TRINITY_DN62449_c0_g1_i1.p1  ORF type:complete len:201 (-),score=13.35 TRINITY_DN62449_c0_g1_i1:144-746(-)